MLRMTEVTRSCLSYAALRLKWQALGFVLVALGRAVVRLERTHGRGAWEMAHHLELVARTAAHDLGTELIEAHQDVPPQDEKEIAALEHLSVIRCLFLALALFARHLMRKLAGRSVPGYPYTDFTPGTARTMIAIAYSPTFIDSG